MNMENNNGDGGDDDDSKLPGSLAAPGINTALVTASRLRSYAYTLHI